MTAFERFENSPLCVDDLSEDSLCPQKMKNLGWARIFVDVRRENHDGNCFECGEIEW